MLFLFDFVSADNDKPGDWREDTAVPGKYNM